MATRKRKKPVAKRREKAPSTPAVPVAEEGLITETTVYPSIAAIYQEALAGKPWFSQYTEGTQKTLKYALYTGIAEALRTIALRMNMDQSDAVFTEFGAEILAYDKELQALAAEAADWGLDLNLH